MSVRKLTIISASGLALSATPLLLYSAWLGGLTRSLVIPAAISISGIAAAWWAMRSLSRPLFHPREVKEIAGPLVEGTLTREAITKEVLDSLPDPVVETDAAGRIVFVNRAALLLAGCDAGAFGQQCKEFLTAACRSLSGHETFEAPLAMRDGSARFFEFKAVRLGGPEGGSLFIGRDSDERKRILDELTTARTQEVEASTKLKKTISDLEEFALLAIRRELKMQELRERFVRLKEEHEISKDFPG